MTSLVLPDRDVSAEQATLSARLPGDLLTLSALSLVRLTDLRPGDHPRLGGESLEHTQVLAETGSPLIVHRATMRIIDGHSHPQWSDRVVATAAGVAARTVASIRRDQQSVAVTTPARVGRDGRVRPISNVEGRQRAGDLLAQHPDASLREIAQRAGISPGTVRDVRDRLRRGEDAVLRRRSAPAPDDPVPEPHRRPRPAPAELTTWLHALHRDPSLRLTDAGRRLLRFLQVATLDPDQLTLVADAVPPHCAKLVADVAAHCADVWQDVAQHLEDRVQTNPTPGELDRMELSGSS